MTGMSGVVAWAALAVILFVIETATVQLVCIWFGIGALVAIPAAAFGAPFIVQLIFFLLFSVVPLFLARPLLLKKVRPKQVATNADRVVGMTGLVLERVDNLAQSGRVSANGLDWMARAQDDSMVFEAGERVFVCAIDGVKLMVQPAHTIEEKKMACVTEER